MHIGGRSFLVNDARFWPTSRQQHERNKRADRELIILDYYRRYRIVRDLVNNHGHQYVARISRRQATRRMRSLNGPLMQGGR